MFIAQITEAICDKKVQNIHIRKCLVKSPLGISVISASFITGNVSVLGSFCVMWLLVNLEDGIFNRSCWRTEECQLHVTVACLDENTKKKSNQRI